MFLPACMMVWNYNELWSDTPLPMKQILAMLSWRKCLPCFFSSWELNVTSLDPASEMVFGTFARLFLVWCLYFGVCSYFQGTEPRAKNNELLIQLPYRPWIKRSFFFLSLSSFTWAWYQVLSGFICLFWLLLLVFCSSQALSSDSSHSPPLWCSSVSRKTSGHPQLNLTFNFARMGQPSESTFCGSTYHRIGK